MSYSVLGSVWIELGSSPDDTEIVDALETAWLGTVEGREVSLEEIRASWKPLTDRFAGYDNYSLIPWVSVTIDRRHGRSEIRFLGSRLKGDARLHLAKDSPGWVTVPIGAADSEIAAAFRQAKEHTV